MPTNCNVVPEGHSGDRKEDIKEKRVKSELTLVRLVKSEHTMLVVTNTL